MRGRVGASGCESSVWTSDTSARCLEGHGGGGSRGASVTASGAQGSVSGAVSMDAGGGAAVAGGAANGLGAQDTSWDVVLGTGATGDGRSWTVRGRVGGSGAQASVWSGDTAVTCRAGMGSGGSVGAVVTVGARAGSASEGVSYDGGWVSSVAAGNAPLDMRRAAMAGAGGGGLGAGESVSAGSRWGQSGAEASEWVSGSSVRGRAAGGVGGSRTVAVTGGGGVGSVSVGLSYDGWQVSGVSTSNGAGAAGYWRAAVGVGAGMLGVLASSAGGGWGRAGQSRRSGRQTAGWCAGWGVWAGAA